MFSNEKVSTFKERFTELFEESKKTTTELAKNLHVSNQTISAWKTGARSPKEPTIVAIANYFNVDVRWLMGFDVEKEKDENAKNYYITGSLLSFVEQLMEEDKDLEIQSLELWYNATPDAKRAAKDAAIAVLKAMKKKDE